MNRTPESGGECSNGEIHLYIHACMQVNQCINGLYTFDAKTKKMPTAYV